MIYVTMNVVISLTVALPAAYAFSRYRFMGDKHLFFWLLTNRMAPPAVFALPFFQLYSSVGLFDTHIAVALAHCLFNVPLAVWILEGFMRGVPKEIDETAYIDGYSFPRFFLKIFLPLIASGVGGGGLLLLHVLLGGAAAQPHAHLGQRQTHRRHHDADRLRLGDGLGRAGRRRDPDHHPRRFGHLFRAQLHRQGLCPGPGIRKPIMSWMAWTLPTAIFFGVIALLLGIFTLLAIRYPETPRTGILRIETTRGDRLFITLLGSAFLNLAWLAAFGAPLWGALILCLVYAAAVFRWV
jgi:glycerol transport system permease protein